MHNYDQLCSWVAGPRIIRYDPGRVLFCTVPKVATNSIKIALMHSLSGEPYPESFGDELSYATKDHIVWQPEELGELLAAGYHTIAIVRNPWARLVSCWADKFEGTVTSAGKRMLHDYGWSPDMRFWEFAQRAIQIQPSMANVHFRPQHTFHEGLAAEVIQIEQIGTEWPRLQSKYDLMPLPRANKTKSRDWRELYTESLAQQVADYYARDIDLYGYEF